VGKASIHSDEESKQENEMKLRFVVMGLTALGALAMAGAARAQENDALLDALVKKGVLSSKEAQDVRADEDKQYSESAMSKISLSSSIKSITFYGDLRLRYELRDGTVSPGDLNGANAVYGHGDSQDRSRWRYRLRFGVKGELYDNFFYGFRLATGYQNDRSGNVTFGDTDNGGVFGNSKSLLGIDRAFIGWKATDEITLTGGKMENPLYTTNLVWDDNLSPTGAAEQFDRKINSNVEVFATAGQFVYGDSADNTANLTGGTNYDDIFLFAEQAGIKFQIDKNTFFKGAATFYTYSGSNQGAATTVAGLYSTNPLNYNNNGSATAENNSPGLYDGPFVGVSSAPGSNVSGIDRLAVLETPFEFDFKAWNVPMRAFADFAYNLEAGERADAARGAIDSLAATGVSNTGITSVGAGAGANNALLASKPVQGVLTSGKGFRDQAAYQIGLEAGQLKKKGDWDGKLYWQSTGYYAVDPNLIDADIFNASTNMQGVVVQVSHNWTDGLSSTLKYAHASPVDDELATPNFNQDLQISKINQYNLFQADLMWKF
jgi:hypothetical protein